LEENKKRRAEYKIVYHLSNEKPNFVPFKLSDKHFTNGLLQEFETFITQDEKEFKLQCKWPYFELYDPKDQARRIIPINKDLLEQLIEKEFRVSFSAIHKSGI